MEREQELIDAIKRGDADRVDLLVSSYPDLADARPGGLPVALFAAFDGQRGIAQALVDYGATVDIFVASALNKADRLAVLLTGNADQVNTWGADGWTPLTLAAYFGARESARLLIAAGADVNARSRNDAANTPLHAAVAGKRPELVDLLVERGADINAVDGRGWTPLNLAAQRGDLRIIEYLLSQGADPAIPNDEGQSPREVAEREGHIAAADLLRRAAHRS